MSFRFLVLSRCEETLHTFLLIANIARNVDAIIRLRIVHLYK
jgi:hypothetical protein